MKRFLYFIFAALMMISATSCTVKSAQPVQTPTSSLVTNSTVKTQTTLSVMAVGQPYATAFDLFANQLKSEYGVTLSYEMIPAMDSYAKYMMEFATKTSSYDFIVFMPAWMPDLAEHLQPMEALAKKNNLNLKLEDIPTTLRDIYSSYKGTLVAMPFDGDQFQFFYRTDVFTDEKNKTDFKTKYGYNLAPPDTWDQYMDLARFFNGRDWDNTGKPKYGTAEAWRKGAPAYRWWMAKFLSYGGLYFDENFKPLINTPAGLKVMEMTAELVKLTPPGTNNAANNEATAFFTKGDVPMTYNWSSTGKAAMDPTKSDIVGKVGVAMQPGAMVGGKLIRRPSLATGWSIAIPKYSKNKDLSMKVVEFISRPENALMLSTNSVTYNTVDPWRKSSFDASKWLSVWPGNDAFAKQLVQVTNDSLTAGMPDLQLPNVNEYIKALDSEICYVITGEKTPQNALIDAEKEWNAITDRMDKEFMKKYWLAQYNELKKAGITYIPYTE